MYLENFVSNSLTQFILAVIAIIEFAVSLVSYIKISKVRKSQIEYRDIIELDNILLNLRKNTDLFLEVKNSDAYNADYDLKNKIDKMVLSNYECIGSVNKANQIMFRAQKKNELFGTDVVYHESGYFNKSFFDNVILNAKKQVVLYIKRNTRPFTLDNLNALINLSETKNVKVKIFAFSPEMEEIIMNEMKKTIPNSPSIQELRETQISNRNAYLERKKRMVNTDNIVYFEYTDYPVAQYIIVDNKMYWGIVNYDKSDMDNVFEDRPYIIMDTDTKFVKYIQALQAKVEINCSNSRY